MGEYLVGNPVTLWEQFLDDDGQPADPTGVSFYVRDPAGTVVQYLFGVDSEVVKTTNDIPGSPFFGATDGFFVCELGVIPQMAGEWHYRPVGTGAVVAANEYEFTMIASSTLAPDTDGPQFGPFTAWCDPDDVIAICPAAGGSDTQELEQWVQVACEVLYEKSGRQFAGLSQAVTCRPAAQYCGCWPWNETWHSWGQVQVGYWSWDYGLGRWGCDNRQFGCAPLSQVKLGGYPVREILQVKVNGDVVDPDLCTLVGNRFLQHQRDPANPNRMLWWPSCQIQDLPDTEQGTFAVIYRYGQDPPATGKAAAQQLACELWKLSQRGECTLPSGTRRATRQAVELEIALFAQWNYDGKVWQTGLPLVDTFLNTYNPNALRRRPSVFSPWTPRFPRPAGV